MTIKTSSSLLKVAIAIIGGGLIGPRHAQSVIKSPNATIIALADPTPHGAQVAAELKTNHYASVEALIKSTYPQTTSSNNMHSEYYAFSHCQRTSNSWNRHPCGKAHKH
jgi:hypothetical protein